MKHKIVVTKDLNFYPDQKERLEKLGEIKYYSDEAESVDVWLDRCKNKEIICTGGFGFKSDNLYKLKNVFISLPFVGFGVLDKDKLKNNNIKISNSPGCNKEAVAEWIIGMLLMYFRKLNKYNRIKEFDKKEFLESGTSLFNKNITILGKGYIGEHLGKICKGFDMKVVFFKRGDNLKDSVKNADIIVNCLSLNKSTQDLLDSDFFNSLKKGSLFVSTSKSQTYDIKELIKAIKNNILIGAIDDTASSDIGDITSKDYKLLLTNQKIFVTPHMAWNSDSERRKANDIMIDNIEAYLNKKQINIVI